MLLNDDMLCVWFNKIVHLLRFVFEWLNNLMVQSKKIKNKNNTDLKISLKH